MSKQSKYWVIGILAAIIVVIIIWVAARGGTGEAENSSQPGSQAASGLGGETTPDDHAGMDHGTMEMPSDASPSGVSSYMKEQDQIMAEMMEAMSNVPSTGNAAVNFLKGMIPHHKSAVDMAKSYLANGAQEPELRQVAQDIITTQEEEIVLMNDMIKRLEEEGSTDAEKEAAYLEEYKKLFDGHHMTHTTSEPGSVDEAFADGMILHHQMAVDMAKAIQENTDDKEVRDLVQNIISLQEKEIAQMEEALNRLK